MFSRSLYIHIFHMSSQHSTCSVGDGALPTHFTLFSYLCIDCDAQQRNIRRIYILDSAALNPAESTIVPSTLLNARINSDYGCRIVDMWCYRPYIIAYTCCCACVWPYRRLLLLLGLCAPSIIGSFAFWLYIYYTCIYKGKRAGPAQNASLYRI
jgi:hypothetical protein